MYFIPFLTKHFDEMCGWKINKNCGSNKMTLKKKKKLEKALPDKILSMVGKWVFLDKENRCKALFKDIC